MPGAVLRLKHYERVAAHPAMICFVNAKSINRIVSSIFNRFNEYWRNLILKLFTQTARRHLISYFT